MGCAAGPGEHDGRNPYGGGAGGEWDAQLDLVSTTATTQLVGQGNAVRPVRDGWPLHLRSPGTSVLHVWGVVGDGPGPCRAATGVFSRRGRRSQRPSPRCYRTTTRTRSPLRQVTRRSGQVERALVPVAVRVMPVVASSLSVTVQPPTRCTPSASTNSPGGCSRSAGRSSRASPTRTGGRGPGRQVSSRRPGRPSRRWPGTPTTAAAGPRRSRASRPRQTSEDTTTPGLPGPLVAVLERIRGRQVERAADQRGGGAGRGRSSRGPARPPARSQTWNAEVYMNL